MYGLWSATASMTFCDIWSVESLQQRAMPSIANCTIKARRKLLTPSMAYCYIWSVANSQLHATPNMTYCDI